MRSNDSPVPCDWVEWGHVPMDGAVAPLSACRLKGSRQQQLFTPDGWTFEGSLSQSFGFEPLEQLGRRYRFLRHENGLDVYLDSETGREVFAGRGGN